MNTADIDGLGIDCATKRIRLDPMSKAQKLISIGLALAFAAAVLAAAIAG
jgi:hypothetical protein